MEAFESLVPPKSAITWNDVSRLAGNNYMGRKERERFTKKYSDAGKCLGAMVDYLGSGYIPANKYIALSEAGIEPEIFDEVVALAAKSVMDQRARKNESFEYWQFVFNNCWGVFEEVLSK